MFFTVMVLLTTNANAQQEPAAKLLRGIFNVVTSPIEVPKQARAYWIKGAQRTPHIIAWIVSGAVWGVVQGVKRASFGVWDVLSSPFAQPSNMTPNFLPEYVLQEWPVNPKSGR